MPRDVMSTMKEWWSVEVRSAEAYVKDKLARRYNGAVSRSARMRMGIDDVLKVLETFAEALESGEYVE
jgi:hypothetical protein